MKKKQKKVLYIAVGAPNSGKTSLIDFRVETFGGVHISRDEIRFNLLKDDDKYFEHEGEVFTTFVNDIQKTLDNEDGPADVYADATHLNKRSRKKLINKLDLSNVDKIIILWFDLTLPVLLERNENREGRSKVPESAITRMFDSMDVPTVTEHPLVKEIWNIDKFWYIQEFNNG